MTEDGALPLNEEDLAEADRMVSLLKKPWSWPPMYRREGSLNVVDLVEAVTHPDMPPHRTLIAMFLTVAVKDRATELHFEPWRFDDDEHGEGPGLRVRYEVNDEIDDLWPPPTYLAELMFFELEAIIGLDSPRHRVASWLRRLATRIDGQPSGPREGRFTMTVHEFRVDVGVMVYHSDLGDRFFLKFPEISEEQSKRTWTELRQPIEDRAKCTLRGFGK